MFFLFDCGSDANNAYGMHPLPAPRGGKLMHPLFGRISRIRRITACLPS
jgi:hypothetical protein